MPQHDMNIANQLFPPTRSDLNNAFAALVSNSSGTSPPGTPVACQLWADTANDKLKLRSSDNDEWLELFSLTDGTVLQPVTVEAVPIGTIVAWPGVDVPDEWSLCDGKVLSRTTYPGLYNILGTRFNTGGETSAQFRKPDLRARMILGRADMGGVTSTRVTQAISGIDPLTLGAGGGNQSLQQHTHTATTDEDGAHTHNYDYETNEGTTFLNVNGTNAGGSESTGVTASGGDHTHAVTVANTGAGTSQNMPPCMVLNYIIYTGVVGATGDGGGGGNVSPTLGPVEALQFACSDEDTAIDSTGVKLKVRTPYAFAVSDVRAYLNSACITGTFTITATIEVAGVPTALFSTSLTIDAGERVSTTAVTPMVLAIEELEDFAELVVTVSDDGDSTATGLKFVLVGNRIIS